MFRDQRIQMFVQSLKLIDPYWSTPTLYFPLTYSKILLQKFEFSKVFTGLYLMAFYSLLWLSNIIQHAFNGFDISRHLARGDVIFSDSMPVLILKWSKTNQLSNKVQYETIPEIPHSLLCPVLACKNMLATFTGSANDHLFAICRRGRWLPLKDSIVMWVFHHTTKAPD